MGWIFKNKKTPSKAPINRDFAKNKIALQAKNKKAFFIVLFLISVILGQSISFKEVSAAMPAGATISACKSEAEVFEGQKRDVDNPNTCYCEPQDTFINQEHNKGCFPKGPADSSATNPKMAKDDSSNIFTWGIGFILTQIQSLVGWLFAVAATLFSWAIEPANISGTNGLLNKPAVKDVWVMVRDLLNMLFILVLLFAAFCTIFQVDKWNLKKVWLNILINALLVNFSFPIARFFIDISNVAFYYFVNRLFTTTGTVTGSGIFAMFGSSSKIGEILAPASYSLDHIAYQIAMIVLTFILGMTLLIIAVLFLVRLVALAMLVMFSPIGFVGYILPATTKWADKWWENLFSYSFFAPIMIFMMAVALKVAESLKTENINSMMSNASVNSLANQTTWIADVAFFIIPIIIIWTGIGLAKSFGVEGAEKVVGAVKSGGKWLSGTNYMKGNYDAFAGARKKRAEEIGKKRWGGSLGDGANNIQDKAMARMGSEKAKKRFNSRTEASNKEDIEKGAKNHIDSGETADSLSIKMNDATKSISERAQAATAYQRIDFDERRAHTVATLSASPAGNYGDHNDAFSAAAANHASLGTGPSVRRSNFLAEQAAARTIADTIKANPTAVTADQHRQLASFINKHAKMKITDGVNENKI